MEQLNINESLALNFGKLFISLLNCEAFARMFLTNKFNPEFKLKSNYDVGEILENSPFTGYKSFKNVLTEYNEQVEQDYKVDVSSLKELRDALAHSKILSIMLESDGDKCSMKLCKFSYPIDSEQSSEKKASVKVEFFNTLDVDWFREKISFVNVQIAKIWNAINQIRSNDIQVELLFSYQ